MKVLEIAPAVESTPLLTGAQFIDSFRIVVDEQPLDARTVAERMFARSPPWVEVLLRLRNLMVMPFGLKTSGAEKGRARDMIGLFPVISETPERLVAGFNDKHLDFRVVVDVMAAGTARQVTATTLVLTHNPLGRTYLAIITPFHRLIVPALLRQVISR
jgi:hypothetical protein